jgi:type IV secretion system protein VirD4
MAGAFGFAIVMKNSKKLDSYGSAAWATMEQVEKMGLLSGEGVILGRSPDGKHILQHDGPEHIICMAPTRSGKGVGVIIPTLLTWKHSTFVTDIKGENWGVTAGYRRKYLGNKVLKFEPTAKDGSSVKFNPLSAIRIRTKDEIEDVQLVADMLVDPDGKGQMDHWAKTGHALLVGTIIHLMYAYRIEGRGIPALSDVASFLSRTDKTIDESVMEMKEYRHISPEEALSDENVFEEIYGEYVKDLTELKEKFRDDPPRGIDRKTGEVGDIDYDDDTFKSLMTHPKVAEAAAELQNKSENERSGVLSTAMSFLGLYRDPVVAANTSGSEFCVSDLMREDFPVSLYLVIPPKDIDRVRPLIRMVINLVLKRLMGTMEFKDGKQIKKKQRCLLLLDEFPAFGNLQSIESGLAFIAGYGLKAIVIVQSLNQLYKYYTKESSIVDTCHIRVFYTPNDEPTQSLVSKMLGKKTIQVKNQSGKIGILAADRSESISQVGRDLMTPDEVGKLPYEDTIVFVAGKPPIRGKKLFYYQEEFLCHRVMDAPKRSDRINHEIINWKEQQG